MTDQQPYTPDTEQVRLDYIQSCEGDRVSATESGPQFDRWLATVEAAAEQRGAAQVRQAVMELHQPYQYNGQGDRFCEGCSDLDWEISYPCQTVQAITDALEAQ